MFDELRVVSYALRVVSYELRVVSGELRITLFSEIQP